MRVLGAAGDQVDQAISHLPSCYTYALARCQEEDDLTAHPRCAEFTRAGELDYDRFQAALERLPVCHDPLKWPLIAALGTAGVLAVTCIALALRR